MLEGLRIPAALLFPMLIMLSAENAFPQLLGENSLDTDAPIEITADSLSYDRDLNVADFQGSVEVVQGTLFIQSDSLRVIYEPAQDSSESTSLTGSISRIEANGNVSIVSEKTEATGDWAIYEVTSDLVTLGGLVRLQSDGNVLVGDRLTINMATGNTRLEAGTAAGSGRVRGVFQPPSAAETSPQ